MTRKEGMKQSQEQSFNWACNNNDALRELANSLRGSEILLGQGQIADSLTERNQG